MEEIPENDAGLSPNLFRFPHATKNLRTPANGGEFGWARNNKLGIGTRFTHLLQLWIVFLKKRFELRQPEKSYYAA